MTQVDPYLGTLGIMLWVKLQLGWGVSKQDQAAAMLLIELSSLVSQNSGPNTNPQCLGFRAQAYRPTHTTALLLGTPEAGPLILGNLQITASFARVSARLTLGAGQAKKSSCSFEGLRVRL